MTAATRKIRSGLTEKQQRFVENMLGGMQPIDAYVEAYKPKMTRRSASYRARDLLNHPRIIAAMTEAQEAARERRVVSLETVTDLLLEAAELARQREQPAALTGAAVALAKLHGLMDAPPSTTNTETLTGEALRRSSDRCWQHWASNHLTIWRALSWLIRCNLGPSWNGLDGVTQFKKLYATKS